MNNTLPDWYWELNDFLKTKPTVSQLEFWFQDRGLQITALPARKPRRKITR